MRLLGSEAVGVEEVKVQVAGQRAVCGFLDWLLGGPAGLVIWIVPRRAIPDID